MNHQFYLAVALATSLLQEAVSLLPAPATAEDDGIAAGKFMGPLPGSTHAYNYFQNGVLTEGETTIVKGVVTEGEAQVRLQSVTRLAQGPLGGPFEDRAEFVLRVSDRGLEGIDSEGRSGVLVSQPVKVGKTWERATRTWSPSRPVHPSGAGWTKVDPRDGTWTTAVATCRIERLFRATLFGKTRSVVAVSCSFKTREGITDTATEEWASGLGMVRRTTTVRGSKGQDLGTTEQRLIRVRKSS